MPSLVGWAGTPRPGGMWAKCTQLPFFFEMPLGEEELEGVVSHLRLTLPNDAQEDAVQLDIERRFQQVELGENNDALPIRIPHCERLALKNLPTVYVMPLAGLAGEWPSRRNVTSWHRLGRVAVERLPGTFPKGSIEYATKSVQDRVIDGDDFSVPEISNI